MTRQFGLFVVAGGIAAAVNWLSRIALSTVMSLEFAVIVAYGIGMTTAYLLNRRFVFDRSGRGVYDEYSRFFIVNLVAFIQVFAVTISLSRWLFPLLEFTWYKDEIAHAIGVVSPIATSFIGHKYFTFSQQRNG